MPLRTGTLLPLVERTVEWTGRKPRILLADSSYASVLDLAACQQHQITLYAPIGAGRSGISIAASPRLWAGA